MNSSTVNPNQNPQQPDDAYLNGDNPKKKPPQSHIVVVRDLIRATKRSLPHRAAPLGSPRWLQPPKPLLQKGSRGASHEGTMIDQDRDHQDRAGELRSKHAQPTIVCVHLVAEAKAEAQVVDLLRRSDLRPAQSTRSEYPA